MNEWGQAQETFPTPDALTLYQQQLKVGGGGKKNSIPLSQKVTYSEVYKQ